MQQTWQNAHREIAAGVSQVLVTFGNIIQTLQLFHARRCYENHIWKEFRAVMQNFQGHGTAV